MKMCEKQNDAAFIQRNRQFGNVQVVQLSFYIDETTGVQIVIVHGNKDTMRRGNKNEIRSSKQQQYNYETNAQS